MEAKDDKMMISQRYFEGCGRDLSRCPSWTKCLFMCFIRSKIFTFSKMLKKKGNTIEIGKNTEGRKKKSTFLCRKNSEVLKDFY